MDNETRSIRLWLALGLSAMLYVSIAYFTQRSNTLFLLAQVFMLFVLLIISWKEIRKSKDQFVSIKIIAWTSVSLRALLFFSFPNLSDDVYRFLWDGSMVNLGLNPYLILPEHFNADFPSSLKTDFLLHKMNSRQYFSVYPPLDQWFFASAVFIGSTYYTQALVLKMVLFLAELLSIYYLPKLLVRLKLNPGLAMFYLLNPLVIIEGIGNLHFEVFSIAFLILFFYFLLNEKYLKAYLSFSFAAGIKLLPMLFIPALIRFIGFRKGALLTLLALIVNGLLFIPFFDSAVIENFFSSIDLYFHRFEFNASVYYIIRAIGYEIVGYNIIAVAGTLLALVSGVVILAIAYRVQKENYHHLFQSLFLSILMYFMFSTTVHPWYIITPLLLSVFTAMRKSVVLWSFLVFISYVTYSNAEYKEQVWLTLCTYAVFLVAFYIDFKQRDLNRLGEKQN